MLMNLEVNDDDVSLLLFYLIPTEGAVFNLDWTEGLELLLLTHLNL